MITSISPKILTELQRDFRKKYTHLNVTLMRDSFLDKVELPSLTEVSGAFKSLKGGKAPGLDGRAKS